MFFPCAIVVSYAFFFSFSRKIDCFKYNFARFVLGSIFLVGCLLLLTVCTDSRARGKDSRSSSDQIFLKNSSYRFLWSRGIDRVQNGLRIGSEGSETASSTLISESNGRKRFEEDFPDTQPSQRVSIILGTFRKKVALADRKLVNPHDYNYIHNVPNACVGRKIELLAGVPTRADSFDARQAIRESWGLYGTDPANNAVVLFFLGSKEDQAVQEKIDAEALKYGDIVQENFVDSYRNLSLKTVALVKWVSTYCSDSTFVLKADDDMYINMPRLIMKLREQLKRGPMFILGAVHYNTEPFRDQKNKWYVTMEEYPSSLFPNYMSGTAYAMTSTAALRLYVESLYVKNLFLEDVYLTGLVADRAAVPRVKEEDFAWGKYDPDGCNFKDKISGHKNSPDEIRKIHRELFDPNLRCN